MRRPAACLLALFALLAPARAPTAAEPPHAWLFGAWTGGLFPVSGTPTAEACLAQPTVIFTRDSVLRASLTDLTYTQRVVATARTNARGTEFVFAPAHPAAPAGSSLLGLGSAPAVAGFGCENPDLLHVRRITDNEIEFPGCADFPSPLVRCPGR